MAWEGRGAPRGRGRLTLACPLIGQQLVALPAAALEAAHGVPAEVVTAPVVDQALIDVCGAGWGGGRRGEWAGAPGGRQDRGPEPPFPNCPLPTRGLLWVPSWAQEGGLAQSRGGWAERRPPLPLGTW